MKLIIYPLLNTRSKRAICRVNKKYGHQYIYNPKYILLSRLSQQLNMSIEEVREQIQKEREFIIKNQHYY